MRPANRTNQTLVDKKFEVDLVIIFNKVNISFSQELYSQGKLIPGELDGPCIADLKTLSHEQVCPPKDYPNNNIV